MMKHILILIDTAKHTLQTSKLFVWTQMGRRRVRKGKYDQRWCCRGRRRKYLCRRKRKATTRRCCPGGIRSKVTICNRNWRRISVKPFVNFLRQFRRGKQGWPLKKLLSAARQAWCRLTPQSKKRFIAEACRARRRGYRT